MADVMCGVRVTSKTRENVKLACKEFGKRNLESLLKYLTKIQKLSIRELGDCLDVSTFTVMRLLEAVGIQTRGQQQRKN